MCQLPEHKQTCSTCAHSCTKMDQEPCLSCFHDEYVKKLPPFGKWEGKSRLGAQGSGLEEGGNQP